MELRKLLKNVLESLNQFTEKMQLPSSLLHVSPDFKVEVDLPEDFPKCVLNLSNSLQEMAKCKHNVENKQRLLDPALVQITASKEQLDQRIAAFISHAQTEVDEQNIQEFCTKNNDISQSGCARTRALYKRRSTNRTHLQVNRVVNSEGPQMQINSQGSWCAPKQSDGKTTFKSTYHLGVEERLHNIEQHVGCNIKSTPRDVYARLKAIEDRVLQLESISPEYFSSNTKSALPRKRSLTLEDDKHTTLVDIDDRIRYLKEKLLNKKLKDG